MEKKVRLLVVASLIMLLFVSACASQEPAAEEPTAEEEAMEEAPAEEEAMPASGEPIKSYNFV